MRTQIGELVTGDFEDNTLTLEIDGDMIIKAGTYAIVPIEDYNKIRTLQQQKDAAPELLAIVKKINAIQGRSWRKFNKETLGYKWAKEMDAVIKKATA